MLKYQLPDFYSQYFSKSLLEVKLEEKLATCDSCAMSKPGPRKNPEIHYQAHLKCCTYHPFQPNFLLGALLEGNRLGPTAKGSIQRKIKTGEYVLPIGVVAPVPHQVEFNKRSKDEFGNREDWLCPFYERTTQNCGIWKYRGAVCTTFFCQSSYGERGAQFWERLSDYLTYVEMALMEEALVMLDFSPRQISENLEFLNRFEATAEELKLNTLPEARLRKIWNGYFDDQEGFFIKCFHVVAQMTKKQFKEAMGEQGKMLEKDLLQALKELQLNKKVT